MLSASAVQPKPYHLVDLASTAKHSHALQSLLRLPAAYGFYVECSTPTALYGFKPSLGTASPQSVPPPSSTETAHCDSGASICHGIPCNFLLAPEVNVSCAHLAAVWGCQNCLKCSGCAASREAEDSAVPFACPSCEALQPPPSYGADQFCASKASVFHDCISASGGDGGLRAAHTMSLLVDDGAEDEDFEVCPEPQDLSGIDWPSVFPLIVFEAPLHSVVAMLATIPQATSGGDQSTLLSLGAASISNTTDFLHRAADLMMRT